MSDEKHETIADIVADIRAQNQGLPEDSNALSPLVCDLLRLADRIEAAAKRDGRLLKTCARWILCHDIYGHMAKELLAECKEVLNDDGRFLFKEDEQ